MSWTKRQLVEMSFDELAIAGYVFDLTPDEVSACIRRLDSMMATWEMYGIRIGYNLTVDPKNADPDQDSGIPDGANETVYLNLAIRQAASFGKVLAQSTMVAAKTGYDALLGKCMSRVPEMQYKGNLPIGAGWKRRDSTGGPFVLPPQDLLTTGPDGLLDMNGPVPV